MNIQSHIKETIKLSFPIALGQLGHVMMGVVDSMMVGKVGYTSLAAASLVNGLFFLVLVIGIGLSNAATPLIAMAKGSNNSSEAEKILNHSLVVNISFSFLLIAALYLLKFAIPLLNQPEEVVKLAIPYLLVLIGSVIPFLLFQTYRQFLEGLSIPNPPMIIVLCANFINAFLNWIFIYGNLGVPALGLFGAGIATTISRWVMAIALIMFVLKFKRVQIYNPQIKLRSLDKNLLRKLISIGLPSGFQYFLEVACFAFAAVMMGWLGSKQLAAHQIAISLASITYMIILGISSAGSIRVGEFFGMNAWAKVRHAGFSAVAIAVTIMFCFGIIFILFNNQLAGYYSKESEVIAIAIPLIIIAALFQIFDGMQASTIAILRGLADTKIPMIISFGAYWIIGIPVAYLLGFIFALGAVGIWIGLLLSLAVLGIWMLVRFHLKTHAYSV